jgi:hypothetical protein
LKRLSTGVLAALFAAGLGLNAVASPTASASHGNIGTNAIAQASPGTMATASPGAGATMAPPATATMAPPAAATMAPTQAPAAPALPPANFGSPPSGQYPILFNDHHVYAKPDSLKQGRVLAALVRGGTVLIPLRSMFEQMGATVSYDASSKTVDVSKPGADVKVTVGKPEVVINGESRPLDVPPMLYHGVVMVPVRVISEGMGAYVQWVPDQRVVVVRYLPPTPPPPPATPPPPPPATPSPTPVPTATPWHVFVAGDYIISPRVYDEFNPGTISSNSNGGFSYRIHGATEFNLFNIPWMVEGDYRQFNYPHNCTSPTDPTCLVTTIGGIYQTSVPAFTVRSYDLDARVGIRILQPRIYVGVGYMWRLNNAGYPRIDNVGFGLEKLPDLDHPFSIYGSIYYFPNVKGNFTVPTVTPPTADSGVTYQLAYNVLKSDIGITYAFSGTPLFIEGGVMGESLRNKTNAPSDISEFGPYAGIGIKF